MLPSYPKVFNLGHPAVTDLLHGDVRVEEKVDGSQFSFGIFDGELQFRSRGADISMDAPPKMFLEGVSEVHARVSKLVPGYIYRGEYLQKPKHNTLTYGRIPRGHIILFDVETSPGVFLQHQSVANFAANMDLEYVPLLFEGHGSLLSLDWLMLALERESILGGVNVEGVVIKAVHRYGMDGKLLMGKYVSEAFKEAHTKEWRNMNPAAGDVVTQLILAYRTDARWNKAIQHFAESGKLQNAPQDIGPLLGEIRDDLLAENGEEIKQALMKYAWPRIVRGVQAGFPQWYKEKLMEIQFNEKPTDEGGGVDSGRSASSDTVGDNVADLQGGSGDLNA